MSQVLLDRANDIKAKQGALASFKGSGFHPKDTVAVGEGGEPVRRKDGREITEPTIDKDLIAFGDKGGRHYHWLVGECATKAHEALSKLYEHPVEFGMLADDVNARKLLPETTYEEKGPDGVSRLTIHRDQWNAFVHAMELAGFKVTESSING